MLRRLGFTMGPGYVLAAVLVGLGLILGPTAHAGSASGTMLIRIEFARPVTLGEALELASRHGLEALEVQHSFTLGDRSFTGFYQVPVQQDVVDAYNGWLAAYTGFLRDVSAPRVPQQECPILHEGIELSRATDELRLDSLTVGGTRSAVKSLQGTEVGLVREFVVERQDELTRGGATDGYPTPAGDDESWVPEAGQFWIDEAFGGGRFVQQCLLWDDASGFGTNSTFEPDFFLNNYDDHTYLDRSQGYWGFPVVTYAASDLPRPYLDTRFTDPDGEKAYTVGTSKPSEIVVNRWYLTYIATQNGDASVDSGKLNAQLGHRAPAWCYTTWCSFSNQNVIIVPAWQVGVPGGMSWQH